MSLVIPMFSFGSPASWMGFIAFILAMLALDLGVFHRKHKQITPSEAAIWTAVWIALSLLFNLGVYFWSGPQHAAEFLAGYLVEKALSVDNLFVFMLLFSYFGVPSELQHQVLFWGILGTLVTRAIFIVLGANLLHHFHWLLYVFGGFLVITAVKLFRQTEEDIHPERNPVLRLVRRMVPVARDYQNGKFMVVQDGRRLVTPLFVVLVTVESTDVVFALDSIPAIFGLTNDSFVVFTSNVFAVLGLRSLYFCIAGVLAKFHYLKHGLSLILAFIGLKMLISPVWQMPILASLAVILVILAGSIVASLRYPAAQGERV